MQYRTPMHTAAAGITLGLVLVGGAAAAGTSSSLNGGPDATAGLVTTAAFNSVQHSQTRAHVERVFGIHGQRINRYADEAGAIHVWMTYPATGGRTAELEFLILPGNATIHRAPSARLLNVKRWCGDPNPYGYQPC